MSCATSLDGACPACGLPLFGETTCELCARDQAYEGRIAALTAPAGEFTVRLACAGNPDFGQDPRRSMPGVPRLTIRVATLRAASDVCRAYIEHHELGGGNWTGGEVKRGSKSVARISYNGRAWESGKSGGPRREISLDSPTSAEASK